MDITEVKAALARGLANGAEEVVKHICAEEAKGRTGGIERAFSKTFEAELPQDELKREVPLASVGATQFYYKRINGRIDCLIPKSNTAFEYKAVRIPRKQSSPLFDVGQLGADHLRLRKAKKLDNGFIIAFLYGPAIIDMTAGRLYQAFHNQMFVDLTLALGGGLMNKRVARSFHPLGWDQPWGPARVPTHSAAVVTGRVGAVALDCRQ